VLDGRVYPRRWNTEKRGALCFTLPPRISSMDVIQPQQFFTSVTSPGNMIFFVFELIVFRENGERKLPKKLFCK